jgi:hypothetical protein
MVEEQLGLGFLLLSCPLIEIISSAQGVGIRVMQGHPAVGEGGVKGEINFHGSSRSPKVFPASSINRIMGWNFQS